MMREDELRQILRRIDHKGYPAYKDTKGVYAFPDNVLSIDHVQGDPFASPSRLHVRISPEKGGFDPSLFDTPERRVALEDHLLRRFVKETREGSFKAHGSGKSGMIAVSTPGQEVLKRSAVSMADDGTLTVRFRVGFPARGRTILAEELSLILFEILPRCVKRSLYASAYAGRELEEVADLADDRAALRAEIAERGLAAFVADGSVLPRESGVSDRPMRDAVKFMAPDRMAVEVELPHAGLVRGMGIPRGVTLIVGGGYHGKSTLLKALERGVYDHVKGDGREFVVTDETAVKLRAEDGRSISDTDISMFIRNLPNGKDTVHFHTEDASGSTSQAAGTVEAIEAGAKVFLIDEDTSATNFMIRDRLMQRVVHREEEPILPFVDRVESLYEDGGISTILVAGSSGAYFEKADHVIRMKEYLPYDITELAHAEAAAFRGEAQGPPAEGPGEEARGPQYEPGMIGAGRVLRAGGRLRKDERIKVKGLGTDGFSINKEAVDLRYVEQIVDAEQTDALSQVLVHLLTKEADGKRTVRELVEALWERVEKQGFAAFGAGSGDHYAMPRKQEVYAMLNRCRECARIGGKG